MMEVLSWQFGEYRADRVAVRLLRWVNRDGATGYISSDAVLYVLVVFGYPLLVAVLGVAAFQGVWVRFVEPRALTEVKRVAALVTFLCLFFLLAIWANVVLITTLYPE
jgi:predicted PurR-regulated permease PerM